LPSGGEFWNYSLLCAASLLEQQFPELLGSFCHLVVNFGTILLCAASLLEQWFPELLLELIFAIWW
jgi:hypothetical protein